MKILLQSVLKKELKARRLTINGVARDCGIPISVLHAWVNGVLPSAKNLHHIATLAEYLEMPISAILFAQEEKENPQTTLFNSVFKDGKSEYRIVVTKVNKE